MAHADDFLALVLGDGVPDGHVIGGQVQFVGAGQWVVARERVREARDRLVQQMEDRALDRPPQRLRQGLDFLPGRAREADEAVIHVFPTPRRVPRG